MIDRLDRMLVAVHNAAAAAETFAAVLGAKKVSEGDAPQYNARRITVRAGDSDFDLLEPADDGLVATHLERNREGLFGAGFSTPDFGGIIRTLGEANVSYTETDDELLIEPDQTHGMRTAIRSSQAKEPAGLIKWVYEVTNIADDHEEAADFYARAFGLDADRFSPIHSTMWGYGGTLTLFDPPDRLDRIEITQTTDDSRSMGRYYARRGASIYMCFVETDDPAPIRERLDAREARYQPLESGTEDGVFIHPSALCGILMGVSRTNVAWRWSGRPELAPARA
ncbi:MAG TPA: hypothetical protein VMR52_10930 [Dehalococcoidia bacterium]|nr:hypothetical protein [Dehalococcoidia bacterium]